MTKKREGTGRRNIRENLQKKNPDKSMDQILKEALDESADYKIPTYTPIEKKIMTDELSERLKYEIEKRLLQFHTQQDIIYFFQDQGFPKACIERFIADIRHGWKKQRQIDKEHLINQRIEQLEELLKISIDRNNLNVVGTLFKLLSEMEGTKNGLQSNKELEFVVRFADELRKEKIEEITDVETDTD